MKRKFTIIDFPKKGDTFGHYVSNSPTKAASKAFTKLARIINLQNTDDKNHIIFTIKDMLQGKLYSYIATRVKLEQPIIKNIDGKEIKYYYKNIITKY
jgi:hypothetical protein